MRNMKLLVLVVYCIVIVYGRNLLDYFPGCERSGLDLATCVLRGLEVIRPRLKYGIPEIDLPPLDPFMMDELQIDTTLNHLKISCVATNIVAYGASDFILQHFRIDNRTYAFEVKVVIPYLIVTADYNTVGTKILFVNLSGTGKFKGTFSGVEATIRGITTPILKDDGEHLSVESVSTQVTFVNSELFVDPDNGSFGARTAAAYINRRPEAVMELLAPVIDANAAPLIKKYLNSVLDAISLDRFMVF